MSSTLRGTEADTAGDLYEIYLKGRPEKGDAWDILKRAADKVKAANCTIVYRGTVMCSFLYQVHKDEVNPIDIASEEFRGLGCRKLFSIKAEDWVTPKEPERDWTAEQEAVVMQQQAMAAEQRRVEEQRRSEEEASKATGLS